MLFFLRSWRNAVVVMIAIPTSLLVTLAAMKLANFTLDTVSLLAMTLIIGILVDDSIVVLENIERHYDEARSREEAAVRGRTEIGVAAIVITLVDVVVFLADLVPAGIGRAFLARVRFGRHRRDAHLALRLVHGDAGAGGPLVALLALATVDDHRRFTQRLSNAAALVRQPRARVGARERARRHRSFSFGIAGARAACSFRWASSASSTFPASTAASCSSRSRIRPARRSKRRAKAMLAVERDGRCDPRRAVGDRRSPAPTRATSAATSTTARSVSCTSSSSPNRSHSTAQSGDAFAARSAADLAADRADRWRFRRPRSPGGIQQPIDEVVSNPLGDPIAVRRSGLRRARADPGRDRRHDVRQPAVAAGRSASSTASARARSASRSEPRATRFALRSAARSRRSFRRMTASKTCRSSIRSRIRRISRRSPRFRFASSSGSIVSVGDVANIVLAPAPPLITRINRQSVVYVGANLAAGSELSNVAARLQRAHTRAGPAVVRHRRARRRRQPGGTGQHDRRHDRRRSRSRSCSSTC